MPRYLQRILNLFDLRLLVWLPGLWLIVSTTTPALLTQVDRYLFFVGVNLSPVRNQPPHIDLVELSPTQMQNLLRDPAGDSELLALMRQLAHNGTTLGMILPEVPRQDLVVAEHILQQTEPGTFIYEVWQTQQNLRAEYQQWLASGQVVIGTAKASPRVSADDRINLSLTNTDSNEFKLLARLQQLAQPPAQLDTHSSIHSFTQASAQASTQTTTVEQPANQIDFALYPVVLAAGHPSLQQPVLWQQNNQWFPGFVMALLVKVQGGRHLQWEDHRLLRLTNTDHSYPLNRNGSIVPGFRADLQIAPEITRHSVESLLRSDKSYSLLILGAEADPALLQVATQLQSLQSHHYYLSPWWFIALQKLLLLVSLVYLLCLLPRVRGTTALLGTISLLFLLVVAQLGWQITQAIWLPLGIIMQYLVFGFLFMSLRQLQLTPQLALRQHYQDLACQWSHQLLQQGQLEQAQNLLTHCVTTPQLLQLLYDIGGQYERKRKYVAALEVYRALSLRRAHFKDVTKRVQQLEAKEQLTVEESESVLSKTLVLADPHSRPQFGRYDIERELGRGAMGVVYLGYDPQIARRVAIKTLDYSRYDPAELPAVKARFFREAEAVGRLRHPNIVGIHDLGEEHDLAFIAMDYIVGQPLSDFITPNQLLPIVQVYQIAIDVADALAYAHSEQVIHRDIKPGNILYNTDSQKVTVTDFGIARIASETRTQTGEIIGSPLYMSPEQVKGQKVGETSDIFSLGVTFFQLLSGELPFTGDNIAGLSYQIVHGKHKSIRDLRSQLPGSASRIINKALQKEPEDRYRNAADMARALRNALLKDFT